MQHASSVTGTHPFLDRTYRPVVPSKEPGIINLISNPDDMAAINCAIMELPTWPPNQHYHSMLDAPGNTLSTRSYEFLTWLWGIGARDIASIYLEIPKPLTCPGTGTEVNKEDR
ncbi:uncharacterized protein N7446_006473 [Penicillium canescens]|uniref:uncharacterized protein n=1 Tax=Penicillium canescens TaxID=5083 RepID=UPI0026DF7B1D|nr:uncharacterized protein N7446_006473 [Penicillium canescens]KAJ6062353.1 hypothetical protein N7446_006473 [Penicillium canescens]